VHPSGNPHFTLDPGTMPIVTANIAAGLGRLRPDLAERIEVNRRSFLEDVAAAARRWTEALAPHRGAAVVSYHDSWPYFYRAFGFEELGVIEDRPGVPPSPQHLAALIRQMRERRAKVVLVESTMLLPLLFVVVAALFTTLAQRMGREMATLPPLRAYTINLAGSLAGVVVLGLISWLELSPTMWFAIAFGAAVPLLWTSEIATDGTGGTSVRRPSMAILAINLVLLAGSLVLVHSMARGAIWSPYYKITVSQQGPDTVVEVNNIFHQSMAPVDQKEYFYQWPYSVFGDTFQDVLILGAGSGTDVAAALRHGVRHVDAVEIDPAIIRLGREHHPDHPYSDPRVTVINDDARHFLRTTTKQYDLVVFALIDSLTMQSSFSGVRLESYMFTEESFHDVRNRLKPDGVLIVYNYFRERWLVDRLANTAAVAFGTEPRVHVHEARAFLGVLMAGPRLAQLTAPPRVPDQVAAFNQSHAPSPARIHERDELFHLGHDFRADAIAGEKKKRVGHHRALPRSNACRGGLLKPRGRLGKTRANWQGEGGKSNVHVTAASKGGDRRRGLRWDRSRDGA